MMDQNDLWLDVRWICSCAPDLSNKVPITLNQYKLPIGKIISTKNARIYVSIDSYLKKEIKYIVLMR